MKLTRENAILPFRTPFDLSQNVGCVVEVGGAEPSVYLWEPGAGPAFGLVIHADSENASIAILHGGVAGTVKVRLLEETGPGMLLYPAKNGQEFGFGVKQNETFPGETYVCAQALEGGVAGELVEAVIFTPEPLTIV